MKAIIKKFTSRKFLMALSAAVCGVIAVFVGESDTVTTLAGAAVTVISTLGYCITEGVLDAASIRTVGDAVADAADALQGTDEP